MARLIVRVTSTGGRAPLARLLTAPLGLDVWEVKPDYVVLQAEEARPAGWRRWATPSSSWS